MLTQDQIIEALLRLGQEFQGPSPDAHLQIGRACNENPWFSPESVTFAMKAWSKELRPDKLKRFLNGYETPQNKRIGIIAAGNVPLVGLHDLVCALALGNQVAFKPASDDQVLMKWVCDRLKESLPELPLEVVEKVSRDMDGIIATGSNNTYRYFEYYFRDIPHLLRKNRKSVAVLSGDESEEELQLLADDVFTHCGLGCRNVSLILLPESMDFTRVIDHMETYSFLKDNHRFANNYTYHKALSLMNQQAHLDNGFALFKEEKSLAAPLGCVYYSTYQNEGELAQFLEGESEQLAMCGR